MRRFVALVFVALALSVSAVAREESEKTAEKKQFVIVLKLAPRLLDDKNWTERDNAAVERHFRQLQALLAEGKLIMAGRTLGAGARQMGLVVLEVESEDEARRIMEGDEAVKEKVMTAELFPFRVALGK